MGKYDGILLCTDYDGTLAGQDGEVSAANCEAIEYFKAEGGLFTAASGRKPGFILDKCRNCLPNAPIIAINGSIITDKTGEKVLSHSVLSNTVLNVLDELIKTTCFHGKIELWGNGLISHAWDATCSALPSKVLCCAGDMKYKAIIMDDSESTLTKLRDIGRQRFSEGFVFERSWATGLEILPKDGGKGAALRKLRSLCGIGIKKVVAAGDFENDLSLVTEADIGYAVGNAVPELKLAADRITVPNYCDSIKKIIEEL